MTSLDDYSVFLYAKHVFPSERLPKVYMARLCRRFNDTNNTLNVLVKPFHAGLYTIYACENKNKQRRQWVGFLKTHEVVAVVVFPHGGLPPVKGSIGFFC